MQEKLMNTLICQIAWWGTFIYLGFLVKQATGEINKQFVILTVVIFCLATFSFILGYNANKIKKTWDEEKTQDKNDNSSLIS